MQPVRGDLRARAHDRGARGRRRAGQQGRPAVARPHLPQGRRHRGRVRRPRPAAASGEAGRGRVGGDRLGRGLRPGRGQPGPRHQRARRRRARRLPRQPQRPQPRLDDPRHRDVQVVPHEEPLLRHLGRPAPPPAGRAPDVRPPALPADPRHRPHVVVPGDRGQPDGVQRLAHDGARLPAARSRPARPGRPDGRARPAAHRDRQGGRRAPLRPARHRCVGAARDAPRPHHGDVPRRGVVRRRAGDGGRPRRRLHPRARRGDERAAGRGDPSARARARRRRCRGRLQPDRRVRRSVGHGVPVGGQLPQRPQRQPRPGRRGDVHVARDRCRRHRAHRARPPRRVALAGARPAGDRRRAAGVRAARGDRDARRGAGACRADRRRQPGPVDARRVAARRRAARPGLHGGRRHLRQRDHPPRRRDPAPDDGARTRPLRPGVPPAGRARHRAVHARGLREGRRPAPRLADLPRDHAAHDGTARAEGAAEEAPGAAGAPHREPDLPDHPAAAPRLERGDDEEAARPPGRDRPRPAPGWPAARPAAGEGQAPRPRTRARGGRRRPARRRRRAGGRRAAADRPAPQAGLQLLDAQLRAADQGPPAPPAADEPRRPRPPRPRRRRPGAGHVADRVGRGRGGRLRRPDARRGVTPPRLRARPRRRPDDPQPRGRRASRSTTSPTPSCSTCRATPPSTAYRSRSLLPDATGAPAGQPAGAPAWSRVRC